MDAFTLTGQINSVKMNVLSRLQHLFQSLPISLLQSFFKNLNKHIRQFIWNGKTPRVSTERLTWDHKFEGLWIPHFKKCDLFLFFWRKILFPPGLRLGCELLKRMCLLISFTNGPQGKCISTRTDTIEPDLYKMVPPEWQPVAAALNSHLCL